MNCKHFKRRSKNYKNYFYCAFYKKEIELNDCKNCIKKEYKERKPINQRTSKQTKLERDRYSIITEDLKTCAECGKKNCNINLHEIFYGTGKRKPSIKYGLVIPLCSDTCHNQVNSQGIHFDAVMRDKWHKIGQRKAMQKYGWDVDKFIEVFGRNYL